MKKNKKLIAGMVTVAVIIGIAIILIAQNNSSKGSMVDIDSLSSQDREILDAEVARAYDSAAVYDFPPDPINIELQTKEGHFFIGFNYNVIEFSSDEACRTFSMDNGKELIALICTEELKELSTVSYVNSEGNKVSYDKDEWIVVNGAKKLYPPENWAEIVEYCETLEAAARE